MEKIANKLVELMAKNEVIDKAEFKAYKYGMQIGLELVINITICVIVAILLDAKIYCLFFLLIYISIRAFAGGLHLSTFLKCTLASSFYLVTIVTCMKKIVLPKECSIVIILLITGGIKLLAPVEDQNRKLTAEEKQKFSKRLTYLLIILSFLSCFFFWRNSMKIISTIALSLVFSFLVLLLGKLKNMLQR